MPLSPHTGSQSLLEHEQPKLQSEYRDGSEYDKTSSLWGTTRLKIINYIITEKFIVKKKDTKVTIVKNTQGSHWETSLTLQCFS